MDIKEYKDEITPELRGLLLEADPDINSIEDYIDKSIKLVAMDGDTILGIIVLLITPPICEIKNIAVFDEYRRKGIGGKLIAEALRYSKINQLTKVIIGTCNSSLNQLRLYQTQGFRVYDVVVGYFDAYPNPIYEDGIRCRDQILLRYELY